MKLVAVLLLTACIVSVAPGQWVEKTILIPDSLSVLTNPGTMLYNAGNNFLFVAGDNGPVIVDGLTDRLIGRASRAGLGPYPACYAAQLNKLYWIGGDGGSRTFVLDGATGRDLASIYTPYASGICYNPAVNRVYVPAYDTSGYLVIINAVNDSIVRKLDLGIGYQATACCNTTDNKVYVLSYLDGVILVIDCAADSVIDTIPVGSVPGQLVYNRVNDKLYCCSPDASVTVIDCRSDTVIARIDLPGGVVAAAYNPVANKLYCAGYSGVAIVSGQGDTLIRWMPLSREARAIVCDSADNLVWCSTYSDTIYGIDGPGDSLCALVAVGSAPDAMCYNPTRNRLYVRDDHLTVVDPVGRQVEKRIFLGFQPAAVCWARSSNKLYCAGLNEAAVAVVGTTNSVQRLIPVGRDPGALAYDRPLGLVCCANNRDSTISIIACNGDSVTATVRVGIPPARLRVDTLLHKAWCSSESAVAAIDLRAESLISIARVPTREITALVADPSRARVYCATGYDAHVVVLDAIRDSIIARVPVGGYAQDLALNVAANLVYCLTQSNEAVAVVDGASLRVTRIIPVGGYPWVLFYHDVRNKLYCANWSDNSITVIDCNMHEPVATIKLPTWPYALAHDSAADRLYCLDRSGSYVSVVDCRRDSLVVKLRVGSQPVAAACAPAFHRMYVANEYGSSLSVIRDTTSLAVEVQDGPTALAKPAPTIIRSVLYLPLASSVEHRASSTLLDISGRKVMDLCPGANDVRALAPGVYFVRQASSMERGASSVTKVVITR